MTRTFRSVVLLGRIAKPLLLAILISAPTGVMSCAILNAEPARPPAIFVNNFGRSMTGYALGAGGRIRPTGTLSYSMGDVGVAVDAKVDSAGNIYVVNFSAITNGRENSVVVFPPLGSGKGKPIAKILGKATGLKDYISAIAVDSDGTFFAANWQRLGQQPPETCGPHAKAEASRGSITAYAAGSDGNVKPIAVIAGPWTGIQDPISIAVDSKGNLFVANGGNRGIVVFPPRSSGNVPPSVVIAGPRTGLAHVKSIALDANDNLYVLNEFAKDEVLVFRAHSTGDVAPVAKISGPKTGLDQFEGNIAVDSSGNLFAGGTDRYGRIRVIAFAPSSNGDAEPLASVTYHWSLGVWAYNIVGTIALLLGFPE